MFGGLSLALAMMAAQFAQAGTGELRIRVTDQSGAPLQSVVEVVSGGNEYRETINTDERGVAAVKRLPFGTYGLAVRRDGFATFSGRFDIRSVVPLEFPVALTIAPIRSDVTVEARETLLDPEQTGAVQRMGVDTVQRRTALPGRALPELVNTQPGWLLEANGVLHPRGSEYQTQYVIDGLPLTDNRSPAFAAEVESAGVRALNTRTGGYPAEYGRKLGGVIEVVTLGTARRGFHGTASASAGRFKTFDGAAAGEFAWERGVFGASAGAADTDRYLDPPAEENFTNHATTSHGTIRLERDVSNADRIGVIVRRGQANFLVPNERPQDEAGQRQDRTSRETMAQFSYQRTFSNPVVADVRGMARQLSARLWSNDASTPIAASQDRGFKEVYVKATVAGHTRAHEWKAGADLIDAAVRERFAYRVTDPGEFDAAVPLAFSFADRRHDVENALFVQDRVRAGRWTVDAGVRWDQYRFVVNQSAVSPRAGVAWAWPKMNLVVRASYDRAFQTPAFENLLLASSPAVETLGADVVHLPVRPSLGHFYEGGFSKLLFGTGRVDASYFVRTVTNFADDDVLLNTGVSFPIAFDRSTIRGAETKFEVPRWRGVSASVSYAWMRGIGTLPITGGLFLGDESAALPSRGTFPVSQDQRHTVRGQMNYQATPAFWLGGSVAYGTGLPFEFEGDRDDAVAQHGTRITDRVNFDTGRVRPFLSLDMAAGVVLHQGERGAVQLQAGVANVLNRFGVINFAGLFSGTALAPPRSLTVLARVDY
jgi:hypothetical protein